MTENDRAEFCKTIAAIGAVHGRAVDGTELRLWFDLFAPAWSLAEFREAAAYLLKTSKWFPKPAEFFELRDGARPDPAGAWSKVIEHASGGWRRLPSCGDSIADQAVQSLGGYHALAMSTERDLSFRRREFVDTYRDLAERDQAAAALPDLRPAANGSRRLGGPAKAGDVAALPPHHGDNNQGAARASGAGSISGATGKAQ